jgi:hypothetical protein
VTVKSVFSPCLSLLCFAGLDLIAWSFCSYASAAASIVFRDSDCMEMTVVGYPSSQ